MTLLLLPLVLIAVYLAMYLMRTDRTRDCRWRAFRRDDDGVHWSCPVCGGTAVTGKREPDYCARNGSVPRG